MTGARDRRPATLRTAIAAAISQVDPTVLLAVIGLVVGYITSLVGYIVLLALGVGTGTLDNLVSLSIGALAGGALGTGAGVAMGRASERRRSDSPPDVDPPPPPDVEAVDASAVIASALAFPPPYNGDPP